MNYLTMKETIMKRNLLNHTNVWEWNPFAGYTIVRGGIYRTIHGLYMLKKYYDVG